VDVAVGDFVPVFTDAGDETLVRFHGWNEHPFSFNDFEAVACESEPERYQKSSSMFKL